MRTNADWELGGVDACGGEEVGGMEGKLEEEVSGQPGFWAPGRGHFFF